MKGIVTEGHRPDCSCSECWHKRIPNTRHEYKRQVRESDPVVRERGIQLAERDFEDRMMGFKK